MELCADVPFQSRYLNNLDQVAFRVAAYAFHSCAFIFLLIVVVELITVTVSLLYMLFLIDIEDT